jgi:phenylacetate-CoA ligase
LNLISAAYWKSFLNRSGASDGVQELEDFANLSPGLARQELAGRMTALIRYFGQREDALPEWRELAREERAEEVWRNWPSLPITTKRDLVTRFPAGEIGRRFGLDGRLNSSGGSTGEPTHFFQDMQMVSAGIAATYYARTQVGWRPGMPLIALWGSDRDLGKAGPSRAERMRAWLRNDWLIGGYLVGEATVDRFLGLLRRHHPAAVFGYTSILEYVARQVLERGLEVSKSWVHTAWNGAEMLFESQSELFRRAFGVGLLNWYGSRELSVIGYQKAIGGPLYFLRPHMFVEVINSAGRPAAAGESGRLIVTSMVGHGTPFIRYEIGDMGSFAAEDQDESGLRALRVLEGRNAGLLQLPNGKQVNSLFWNQIFKEFPEIYQFQVVVPRSQPGIQLRLVGTGMSDERTAKLHQVLNRFTAGIPISITWMDQIPLTQQGKLMQVVHE